MSKSKELELPEIFFDWNKERYWIELEKGRFVTSSESKIKNHLQMAGMHTELKNDQGLSCGDEYLRKLEIKKGVDYAGPLAGYKAGLYTMQGDRKVLVTESCRPVQPGKNKKFPFISEFLDTLLGDQTLYYYSWLKLRWESIITGIFTPSQLLAICGAESSGKSFSQWLITQLLGGRSAKPHAYMIGKTNFTEDIAESESLVMGDEEASFDIRSRKAFAAKIKQMTVEPDLWIHGKGKKAITLETRRALSITINDEPEHMMAIPPLDSDMFGKIILLRCSPASHVIHTDRLKNQSAARAELPALAAFLHDFKIPRDIQHPRFGVKAYHHPELLSMITDSSPENQLLTVIDDTQTLFGDKEDNFWRGSAEQLKVELLSTPHRDTISGLLSKWPSACGTYLGRLKQKFPNRFESRTNEGKTVWIIRRENSVAKQENKTK